MNNTLMKTSIALAAAGLLSTGAALAQSPTDSATATPSTPGVSTQGSGTGKMNAQAGTNANAPMGTTAQVGTNAQAGTSAPAGTAMGMPSKTDSATAAFNKLDTQRRGYLTAQDVSKLNGIDFAAADKNHDGKLSSAEFDAAWSGYAKAAK